MLELSHYGKRGGYIYLQQSYLKACKATGKKSFGACKHTSDKNLITSFVHGML